MRKYLHQWGIEVGKKSEQNKTVGGEGEGGGGGLSNGCKTSTSKTMIHVLFAVDMFVE